MSDVDVNETRLRLERLIASPPEVLFGLWTEPAQVAKWWGPDGYQTHVHSLQTSPGGHWRISLHSEAGEVAMSGVYRVVEPPRRLVFTWAWEDAAGTRGHETEVAVTFEAAPGGTRLVVVQQHFESAEPRNRHTAGWAASLDRLAALAT